LGWPNFDGWKALAKGERFEQDGDLIELDVVDCGELYAPTGRLVICDPFTGLQTKGNPVVSIPPGRYRVKVTLADVSGKADGSHMREAYATLILDEANEVSRGVLSPLRPGEVAEEPPDGEFIGFPVDAGTACFIDEGAIATGMPPEEDWYEGVFENADSSCWFNRMDDPNHIRKGIANVALPRATDGSNAILMHSGWGDGVFPVVGGYDAAERLVRIHIDFEVVNLQQESEAA
jgi:hypothetical protein